MEAKIVFEQYLYKLKRLDLRRLYNLIQSLDITGVPRLGKLYLSCCRNLVQIHPSFVQLSRLIALDLEKSDSFINFWSMTTKMEFISTVTLCGCSKIKKITEIQAFTPPHTTTKKKKPHIFREILVWCLVWGQPPESELSRIYLALVVQKRLMWLILWSSLMGFFFGIWCSGMCYSGLGIGILV